MTSVPPSAAPVGPPPNETDAFEALRAPSRQRIGKASPLLFLIGIAYLVLRFVAIVLIAYSFGAGRATDLFFWALLIPVTSSLLNRSVINLSFIPVFTERLVARDERGAWRVAAGFLNLILVAGCGLALLYAAVSPWFFGLVAGGLGEGGRAEAVSLTRILSPILVLVPLFAFAESILYSYSHYTTTSLATVLTNLGTIAGVVLLAPSMGIAGVAWGTLAGYALQLVVPLPLIAAHRGHYAAQLGLDDPGMRKVLANLAPIFYVAVNMIGQWLIVYALSTRLGPGVLSAIRYGATLVMILPQLVQSSLLTPLYPRMAEKVAAGKRDELVEMIGTYFRIITFAVLPLVVVTMVLREPLVRAIFERGRFSPEDTAMTGRLLFTYAPWMLAMCYSTLLFNVYLSLGKALRVAKLLTVQLVLLAPLALGLMELLGEAGIPLGISLIFFVQTFVLVLLLRRELGGLGLGRLLVPNAKILLVALLVAWPTARLRDVAAAEAWGWIEGFAPGGAASTLAQLGLVALVGAAGLAVYLALAWLVAVPEARRLARGLGKRRGSGDGGGEPGPAEAGS